MLSTIDPLYALSGFLVGFLADLIHDVGQPRAYC